MMFISLSLSLEWTSATPLRTEWEVLPKKEETCLIPCSSSPKVLIKFCRVKSFQESPLGGKNLDPLSSFIFPCFRSVQLNGFWFSMRKRRPWNNGTTRNITRKGAERKDFPTGCVSGRARKGSYLILFCCFPFNATSTGRQWRKPTIFTPGGKRHEWNINWA